jgi:hypothetical protein
LGHDCDGREVTSPSPRASQETERIAAPTAETVAVGVIESFFNDYAGAEELNSRAPAVSGQAFDTQRRSIVILIPNAATCEGRHMAEVLEHYTQKGNGRSGAARTLATVPARGCN